jgi:hypothetical protein
MKFAPDNITENNSNKNFIFLMILVAGFVLGVIFTLLVTNDQTDNPIAKETVEEISDEEANYYHDELMVNALQSMRAQAELSYDRNNFTYSAVCTDPNTKTSLMLPVELNDLVCRSSDTAYVIYAPYRSQSNYYKCIDSNGEYTDLTEPPVSLSCY